MPKFLKEFSLVDYVISIIGIIFFVMGVFEIACSRSKVDLMFSILLGVLYGGIAGLCFAVAIVPKIAGVFIDRLSGAGDYLKAPPEKLAPIIGMIEEKKYDEAHHRLEDILTRFPNDPFAVKTLAELYMDKLMNDRGAFRLIGEYIHTRSEVSEYDADLLMRYVDLCEKYNETGAAVKILEAEQHKTYSGFDLKAITQRLDALKR